MNKIRITGDDSKALHQAASALMVDPTDLAALIMNESSWNARAYNPSGATGLLQWMPIVMAEKGYISPELKKAVQQCAARKAQIPTELKEKCRLEFLWWYPDRVAQLSGPVVSYLHPYVSTQRPRTLQMLCMAVFYPAYRWVPPHQPFPEYVQRANPGITCPGDYVAKVERRKSEVEIIDPESKA